MVTVVHLTIEIIIIKTLPNCDHKINYVEQKYSKNTRRM